MKLKKELNLLHVFSITTGTMMSSGLFILPGLAYAKAGPGVIISYFIAALLTIPGLLSQAELSTAMPKSGGSYFFITRSMGPAIGSVYGLITWFALSLKSSFALVGMTVFISIIVSFNEYVIAVVLCLFFMLLNIVGAKVAGKVQVVLVGIVILLLIIYSAMGLDFVETKNLVPFLPMGFSSVFATAGFVFISYGGLLKVASIAEEVKDPGRVLPLGMILSILVVSILYIIVVFVTTGVLDSSLLNNSLTPISLGAEVIAGKWGYTVLSIGAILAFTSASNAGILAASRYPMALGRDRLLPDIFGRLSSRFHTPYFSILITGSFIILSLLLKLEILIKAASSVVILTYLFTSLAIIILRESKLQNYQPSFKSPLYPWIQIAGIIGMGYLLFQMGQEALIVSIVLVLIGSLVYLIYGRHRGEKEYALLHLIERITAKELTTYSLEDELREVLRERDEITKDRFDRIIEQCSIIDREGSITMDDLFTITSKEISNKLDINPKKLKKLFLEREKDSSTALGKDFAIPHIIIKGEKKFEILLVRSKKGIYFSEYAPSVHAVFFLIGTKDERNFHLRSLSAIAQIVQDSNFEQQWLSAKDVNQLRDIILLGKRRR